MSDELVTRKEAQQAFETLCKYLMQHKKPDEALCLFVLENYDFMRHERYISLHNADRDFEMRCYIGSWYREDNLCVSEAGADDAIDET
jgi:hypothetical protein